MNQEKKYEAPDVEFYSFRTSDVIMDCTGDYAGPCTTDNICVMDGGECIMDGVSCILDGTCPLDGYCFTENTSTNG